MHKCTSALISIFVAVFVLILTAQSSSFNGTTYYLGYNEVDVVQPINASKFELVLSDKTENITLIDSAGQWIKINSTYTFWRGEHTYSLDFGQYILGSLRYTIPHQGQQFLLIQKQSEPVRIVLPYGYTTGDRLLGIARPSSYDAGVEENRTSLTWQNTSKYQIIEVNYYEDTAPTAMRISLVILAILALGLLIEYYLSMRRLRSIREENEKKL
ncbi:MAG: DUF5803 family protein [Methanotrichaceae archaeon]|nr:DUF5803 family protein [Methanotrichaceae archaeon]